MDPVDPQQLRISDADRDKVAEVLRGAAGDGRIDLTELDERLEATYSAKTYADLVPITIDLPTGEGGPHAEASPTPRSPGVVGAPTYHGSFAIMSGTKRVGPWTMGDQHTATALMGSVTIDLREATLPREAILYCNAVMGSVEVIVDARTAVRVEGVGVMGSFQEARTRVPAEIDASSPVVRVRGIGLMGSVEIKRRGPRGELRRRLLGH